MNQLISVWELMNLYLYHNSDQKTSPQYTLKLQNQYKTTFFFPTVIFWLNLWFVVEIGDFCLNLVILIWSDPIIVRLDLTQSNSIIDSWCSFSAIHCFHQVYRLCHWEVGVGLCAISCGEWFFLYLLLMWWVIEFSFWLWKDIQWYPIFCEWWDS